MEIKAQAWTPDLRGEDQSLLLGVARASIAAALRGDAFVLPGDLPASLAQPRGTFVSLHLDGGLRGCIGVIQPRQPLAGCVAHCARAAALEDPRFLPLPAPDLRRVIIEISVLGAIRLLGAGEVPRPGVDGAIVSQGGRQALLLPQVATERGWSARRFLEETCNKAGLPRDAWERGAQVEVFRACVFSERILT